MTGSSAGIFLHAVMLTPATADEILAKVRIVEANIKKLVGNNAK
jgi:hypothetical protein